jgi:hypothetical protein
VLTQKSNVNMKGRQLQSKKKRSIWKDVLYRVKTVNMDGRPIQSKKQSVWKAVYKGHGTVGAGQGGRHGTCELKARHGRGTAWARHGHGMLYVNRPINAKLNPICHLLALLGAHHILHVSRIRVNCSF